VYGSASETASALTGSRDRSCSLRTSARTSAPASVSAPTTSDPPLPVDDQNHLAGPWPRGPSASRYVRRRGLQPSSLLSLAFEIGSRPPPNAGAT